MRALGTLWGPGNVCHLFDQQLTALFDDGTLDSIVSTDDEAANKQGHIVWFATASSLNNFVTFSTRDMETTNRLRGCWTSCLGGHDQPVSPCILFQVKVGVGWGPRIALAMLAKGRK